jgi:hypothetical protein
MDDMPAGFGLHVHSRRYALGWIQVGQVSRCRLLPTPCKGLHSNFGVSKFTPPPQWHWYACSVHVTPPHRLEQAACLNNNSLACAHGSMDMLHGCGARSPGAG